MQLLNLQLNKDIDLTPDGSIKIGDTNITDNGLTINGGPSITKNWYQRWWFEHY